jgi:hypothetical protein
LCEVTLQGRVWCPSCLQLGKAEPVVGELSTQRTLFDSIALALALWPLLTVYFPLLTAPVVIYLTVRYWRSPSSLIPRNKWRFIVALLLALLELGALVSIVIFAVAAARRKVS